MRMPHVLCGKWVVLVLNLDLVGGSFLKDKLDRPFDRASLLLLNKLIDTRNMLFQDCILERFKDKTAGQNCSHRVPLGPNNASENTGPKVLANNGCLKDRLFSAPCISP